VEALVFTDQALVAYQEAGDASGFAEILASRFITLRHLFEKTGDKKYLILAKYCAESSVEIADLSENEADKALPLASLAKAQELLGEYDRAVKNYRQVLEILENNPPGRHDRPAVRADFKVDLVTCEYRTGDKSALERAVEALSELEKAEETDEYAKKVWLSGGHMRIAEVVFVDDPELAKIHLAKAKEIIYADERLSLRLEQWKKLVEKLGVTGI